MLEAGEAHAAALLGLEAVTLEIRQAEDITTAFEMLRGEGGGHCISRAANSSTPTGCKSTTWLWPRVCRRCTPFGRWSNLGA